MITWKNKKFYKDGEPFSIYGGSIHYFRSLPEKWYDLLLKLKNCGLNTVETYCAWNLHEPEPGVFCFDGRLDIERFIQTATELGLYVIIRPGPYICAEWEHGGLPGWLLKDPAMKVRTEEGEYLHYVKRYFDHLMPHILPYLETNGGNVILMAAENEYGSYGNSTSYMNSCATMLREYGVDVPIFTADGHMKMFLDGGHADDCLCALDFGYDQGKVYPDHVKPLSARQPEAPWFHVEFWIGMFAQWGEPQQNYPAEYVEAELRKHLEMGMDFVFYMFHGGTNFGFYNGANSFNKNPEKPLEYKYFADVTSYDYDAPLTEWGEITPKYLAIQKVMSEHLGVELPKPEPVPVMEVGDVELTQCGELFDNLDNIGKKYQSACIQPMEHFDQSLGFILYRTEIPYQNDISYLALHGVSDLAHVYFNGIYRGSIHRNDAEPYIPSPWMIEGGTLEILVENLGRVNFGAGMLDGERKGIQNRVVMQGKGGPGQNIFNWEVYTLPMEDLSNLTYNGGTEDRPMFYKGTFSVKEKKDCFVHLDNFEKGFVVVNGFNIGRYWEIGPQKSLYLPASLLKDENEIVVFDIHPTENPVLSIRDYHILGSMTTDKGPETIM